MKVIRVRMGKVLEGALKKARHYDPDDLKRWRSMVDLTPKPSASPPLIEHDTPQLRADLAAAADFLLPVAQEHVKLGKWPLEVSAWLVMVRDSFVLHDQEGVH